MSDFDVWNSVKKDIEAGLSERKVFPKEGEVWMIHLGRNIGFEQNGQGNHFARPVVILKKFNNQMFLAIPLSTKQKDLTFYYNFIDLHGQKVSAVVAQIRLISVKRIQRKMYELDRRVFEEIKCLFKTCI